MIGNVLGNRYEIISQLGGGGMAIVYKGRDTLLNRRVTIKVLRSEFTSDDDFVARFRKEAQAVAKLSHPNIVSVYDVGQEKDIHYIVMEFIEGKNLKEIINDQGRIPLKQAVDFARQICEGLADAHENGIIHRDIKPHNILVTEAGRIKVTDFGIAQMISSVTITKSDTVMGSVHYFSPEQARGGAVGAKSDIYSVGVVLYEMVTGQVPFQGETPIAVALKHIESEPVPPARLNPKVSRDLERVIMRAMQRDVTLRYKSAGDMARDLSSLLGDRVGDTRIMSNDEFATQVMKAPLAGLEDVEEMGGDPAARRKKRKMKPLAKILILAVILGLLAGGAYYGVYNYLNVPDVEVPNVVDLLLDEAKEELSPNLSYKAERTNHPDPNKKGYVIKQNPEAGAMVKKDTVVILTYSTGPELTTVPNVVKKEKDWAVLTLENEDFEVSVVEEFSSEPVGIVVSQTPAGDDKAPVGSTVKIVVSKGIEPKYIPVPNLIGLSLEQAKQALEAAKLKMNPDVREQESNDYLVGMVVAQEPMPGSNQILEGSEVKITISKGPGPQTKTARVNVELPNDGKTHQVKIVVIDAAGTRPAYEGTHQAGERFSKVVTYLNRGRIQVFIDDFNTPWRDVPVD